MPSIEGLSAFSDSLRRELIPFKVIIFIYLNKRGREGGGKKKRKEEGKRERKERGEPKTHTKKNRFMLELCFLVWSKQTCLILLRMKEVFGKH